MNTQEKTITTNVTTVTTKQIIKQVIKSWESQNKFVTTFFNKYADDVYLNEVSPGRNRAIYLLGHLISSNDGMIPMFGLGDRLFPHLELPFSISADKAVADIHSIAELKKNWETLNTTLSSYFNNMEPTEWMEKHTKVSEEDFAVDPLRNKLNVLIGRTNHQSYHAGQLAFLSPGV